MEPPRLRRDDDFISAREMIHWIETYKNTQARVDQMLGEIRDELKSIRTIFNGNPELHRKGLLESIHMIADKLTMIEGDLYQDKTGEPGIVKIVRAKAFEEKHRWDYKKVSVQAALAAIAAIAVAVLSNIDRVANAWKMMQKKETAIVEVRRKPKRQKAQEAPRAPRENVPEVRTDNGPHP